MVFINNGQKPHKEWNKVEGHDKHPMPKTAMATTWSFLHFFLFPNVLITKTGVCRGNNGIQRRRKWKKNNWNEQKWRWRRAAQNAGKRKHNKTFHYFKIIVMIYLKIKFIICLYFDIRTQMKTSEHNVRFVFRLFVLICVAVSLFFDGHFYLFRLVLFVLVPGLHSLSHFFLAPLFCDVFALLYLWYAF